MSPARPRNVLWIMSDQHSPAACGYAGNPVVQTPQIDRLAASGLVFENAYTSCPVCVPARFSMLTGKYPHTFGCEGGNAPLPFHFRTLAHALSGAGYATAFIGKLHPVDPQPHGFDFYVDMGHYYDYLGPKTEVFVRGMDARDSGCGSPWVHTWYHDTTQATHWLSEPARPGSPPVLEEPDHFEAFVARNCRTFLERYGREHPFFLFASMIKPHYPQASPPEYHARYRPEAMAVPQVSAAERADVRQLPPGIARHWFQDPHASAEALAEAQRFVADYYAATTYMDECVGRILQSLDELGLAEDTLVLYTSDHGEMLFRHGLRQKFVFYEESARVPFIMRCPGLTAPGARSAALTDFTDLAPTVFDLLGLTDTLSCEGVSLAPVLASPTSSVRPAAYSELAGSAMIRTGHYKLARYAGGGRHLFDLHADREEVRNLAGDPDYAQMEAELEAQLEAWLHGERNRDASAQPLSD